MNRGLFERRSRIAGNSVYDRSGQETAQTALSGAFEALLVRQDRGFMRSELCGKWEECFLRGGGSQANPYDDKKCKGDRYMVEGEKRILFVCNYFAPENAIAAVRTTKLVKYLRLAGFHIDVLTERKEKTEIDDILKKDAEGICIFYVENSKACKKIYAAYQKLMKPHKDKRMEKLDNRKKVNPKTGKVEFYPFETAYPVIGSLDYISGQMRQKDLARIAGHIMKGLGSYDYIITSYGDSFAYYTGKKYKRKNKNVKWIFDIRDAIYRYKFTPDYVKWFPKRQEQYVWENADCVLGVSKGICKRVPHKYRYKVHCLTNGYDWGDREGLGRERLDSPNMIFTYTGSMYGGLQDLTAFFQCIRMLVQKGKVDEKKMEFHFAGNGTAYEIFKSQAATFALESRCVYEGKLSRSASMELQQRSDILLMATYDYQDNEGGIITGKALEYMASEKPVIAIVTGDVIHSELADIVRKTNIGAVYEQSHHKEDLKKLCEYVSEQYLFFSEQGYARYLPDQKEVRKYDYRNICRRLEKIINTIE